MDTNTTLTLEEQELFRQLIKEAEEKNAEAQTLAEDASQLAAITTERLNDYKDRGFFKRCWYKFSGKQGELDRANQADLIKIQRYAWIYLAKLQEQNLMQMSTITTIYERLKQVIGEVGKIQDEIIPALIAKLSQKIKEFSEITDALKPQIGNHDLRLQAQEQLEKFCIEIKKLNKSNKTAIEIFEEICKLIRTFFKSSHLSNRNKEKIVISVSEENFPELSAADLNIKQQDFVQLLSDIIPDKQHSTGVWENFLKNECILKAKDNMEMHSAVAGVLDAVSFSEADRYFFFKSQLIDIINDFNKEKVDVDNQYTPGLEKIRKRLSEDQFEIALIGEFQGGKSTTFNTLCGGREISPRGLAGGGEKTSAAIVSVQNISGNETKNGMHEWAEISWLSDDEITETICEVLEEYDYDTELLAREKKHTKLSNIEKLLAIAWEKVKQIEDTSARQEALDLLQIATLRYRLLKSGNLENIRSDRAVPINKFQTLVKFPADWANRWRQGIDADFSLEESKFAIVDHVLVRLHSTELARLGCRITDCPGLFVSKWDTTRAIEAMGRSNMIWYLLNDKELGDYTIPTFKLINDYKWQDKCFFTINQKQKANIAAILSADMAKLSQWGFDIDQIFVYNAYLAFKSAQLKALNSGILSVRDYEYIALENDDDNCDISSLTEDLCNDRKQAENSIKEQLVSSLHAIREKEIARKIDSTDDLLADDVLAVEHVSGINDILNFFEKYLISNKARSILINEGSRKCHSVLTKYQNALELDVKLATINSTQAEEQKKRAEEILDDFCSQWEKKFYFLDSEYIDSGLVSDFFNSYNNEICETIKKDAVEICIKEWKGKLHTNAKAVDRATECLIKRRFEEVIKAKLTHYRENIFSYTNFKNGLHDPTVATINEMRQDWQNRLAQEQFNELLKSIKVPDWDITDDFDFIDFNDSLDGTIDTPTYFWNWFFSIFKSVEKRIKEFFDEEDPVGKAYKAFRGDPENEKKIAACLSHIRLHYKAQLNAGFNEMRKNLDDATKTAMTLAAAKDEVRQAKAKESQYKKEKVINPCIEKITDFERNVEYFYDEAK